MILESNNPTEPKKELDVIKQFFSWTWGLFDAGRNNFDHPSPKILIWFAETRNFFTVNSRFWEWGGRIFLGSLRRDRLQSHRKIVSMSTELFWNSVDQLESKIAEIWPKKRLCRKFSFPFLERCVCIFRPASNRLKGSCKIFWWYLTRLWTRQLLILYRPKNRNMCEPPWLKFRHVDVWPVPKSFVNPATSEISPKNVMVPNSK